MTALQLRPQYLWFLTLAYVVVILLANWFDPRLIQMFGLVTDAGTLIFPLTFILADLITEVYGYKHARRAIWCGFLFNLLFVAYGQLVIHLPSPPYAEQNASFDALHAFNVRIIVASLISYLCAEPLNSLVLAKLKIKMRGQWLAVRFVLSTVLASGLDSLVFTTIAFFAVINNSHLISMIMTMWIIKVFIEILGLPLSTYIALQLKKIEKLDIYDDNTQFNLFSLNTRYTLTANHFPPQI